MEGCAVAKHRDSCKEFLLVCQIQRRENLWKFGTEQFLLSCYLPCATLFHFHMSTVNKSWHHVSMLMLMLIRKHFGICCRREIINLKMMTLAVCKSARFHQDSITSWAETGWDRLRLAMLCLPSLLYLFST